MIRLRRAATLGVAVAMVAGLAVPANALNDGSGISGLPAVQNAFDRLGGLQRAMFLTEDPAIAAGMVLTAAGASAGPALDSACVAAVNTPAATHIFQGTASDETMLCNAAPAINVLPNVARMYGVTVGAYSAAKAVVTAASLVLTAAQLYNWLQRWLEQVLPGSGGWIGALAGIAAWNPPAPTNSGGGPVTPPPPPPAPAPAPVTERDLVISRIFAEQPGIDPAVAGKATDQCIASEKAAAMTGQPCTTMPILFPGFETGAAGMNDLKGILSNPSWFQLTYLSGKDKLATGVSDGWYERKQYREFCKDEPRRPRGVQCDEFPWYTTVEGGPGARLEEVPILENRADGQALRNMQDDFQCQMAFSAPGVRDNIGSGTQRFLVVPLIVELPDDHGKPPSDKDNDPDRGKAGIDKHPAYAGPPSFHICRPATVTPPVVIIS